MTRSENSGTTPGVWWIAFEALAKSALSRWRRATKDSFSDTLLKLDCVVSEESDEVEDEGLMTSTDSVLSKDAVAEREEIAEEARS